MNKKEIREIKKLFTPANCSLTRICSCYVDAEKNKRAELKEAFLSLPEEEAFKYFNIFRGALSGTVAKNLINLELEHPEIGVNEAYSMLLWLRDSQLKDDKLINEFYDNIIESYDYGENYYIVLVHGIYDVPGRAQDGTTLEDASDYVYEFVQCAICPVKLTKGALSYNTDKNAIESRKRDWIVESPDAGFLFPAFNDRQTDIHAALFYNRKPEHDYEKLITQVLGARPPMTADSEKGVFNNIAEEVLGDNCTFYNVRGIYEDVLELVEESEDGSVIIDKNLIRRLLEENGGTDERLAEFDSLDKDGFYELSATNLINTKAFEIKTEGLEIKVKPEYTSRVECRMIDGRPCIVMAVSDHLEVGGITARPIEVGENLDDWQADIMREVAQ